MQRAFHYRPSATMIVALVALVVAASGTAVAANSLVPGDKLIAKHSLSGNRLRNHTITGKQVNLPKLGKVPSAATADQATSAGHAASADQATSAKTAGSAPLSRVDYESKTVDFSVDNAGTVACPQGLDVVSGGARVSDQGNDYIIDTAPAGRNGWEASGFGFDGDTMTVYAICAPAAQTTP